MERAEAVMDKTETKVDRIVSKGKANKERRVCIDLAQGLHSAYRSVGCMG